MTRCRAKYAITGLVNDTCATTAVTYGLASEKLLLSDRIEALLYPKAHEARFSTCVRMFGCKYLNIWTL